MSLGRIIARYGCALPTEYTVPVFPLSVVLLPRMPLPLHIFESRYRDMVRDCLVDASPFAVVLHTGKTMQSVGGLARIEEILQRYDDGRMDILTVGTSRVRVLELDESKSYLQAKVCEYADIEPPGNAVGDLIDSAVQALTDFAEVAGYTIDRSMISNLSPEDLSFLLATIDLFAVEDRQRFLEMRSSEQRINEAARSIREAAERRRAARQIRTILGKDADEDITHLFN